MYACLVLVMSCSVSQSALDDSMSSDEPNKREQSVLQELDCDSFSALLDVYIDSGLYRSSPAEPFAPSHDCCANFDLHASS